MLRGPIGFALSLAGVGGAAKMVGQAVGQGQDEAIGNDKLLRTLRDSALDFDKLRDAVRGAAGAVGVTFAEMGRLSTRYSQIAGSDIGSFVDRAGFAAGVARGYGIDASEGVSLFARGENAGLDPKALAAAIGDVIEQSGMQGRQDEVARAITKWAEGASRQTGSDPQAKDFADMYIGLNSIAGAPGLHGANAEAIISSMNNTITQGGAAGQASQVFASRALADAGVRDAYAQQYLMQGGMFQNLSARGGKNETVLDAEMDRLNREYGPGLSDVKLSAFQGITGLNTHLGEQWLKHYRPGDSTSSQRYMAEHHIDFSKIGASGYAEISEARSASLTDLPGLRDKALAETKGLTDAERAQLKAASGENLREGLIRAYAAHGMTATQGSETVDAQAKLSNSLTALGSLLVTPLNSMDAGIGKMLTLTATGVADLEKFLSTGTPNTTPGLNPDGSPGDPYGTGSGGVPFGGGTAMPSAFPISYQTRAGGGYRFSGGSGQPALSSPQVAGRARQAMAYFEGKGWSHEAAAGIVANLIRESGLREGAIGDNGQARGLMQEHSDRFADTAAGIGADPTSSFEAGLAGVQYALTQGHDAGTLDTGRFLRGGHSAGENGAYFSLHAERPGNKWGAMADRSATAEELARSPRMRSGGGTASGGDAVKQVAVVRVIHETPSGRVLRMQEIPFTTVPRPEIA
jgi:hypothetical protein